MPTPGPDLVYELFNVYANWDGINRGGIPWGNVKLLLREMDILEGIPGHLVDAYVREVMLRADQDQDGLLSCQEFMVWLFSECCALLPFKHLGAPHSPVVPLYNRFLYLCQQHRAGGAAYRKVSGMSHTAFMQMCQNLGWCDDPRRFQRNSIFVAMQASAANRTKGQMEAGTRLQFTAFMLALQQVASRKSEGWDAIIYKVVGDGSPPPILHSHGCNKTYRQAVLQQALPLLLEGPGGGLRWTTHTCPHCNEEHSLWVGTDPGIRELLRGRPVPGVQYVNVRNVRAAFNRYCLRYNKGLMPPGTKQDQQTKDINDDVHEEDPWGYAGYSECSCMYKQLGLMEMQTFWKVVADNRTLHGALQPRARHPVLEPPSDNKPKPSFDPLVPERVEAAFLTACSVAGVYCTDRGAGIHDKPKGAIGNVRQSSPSRPASPVKAYGTPFNASSVWGESLRASSARPTSTLRMSTMSCALTAGLKASIDTDNTRTSQTRASMQATHRDTGISGCVHQHRPAAPRLTFPQFLEALRLLAEDMRGHPQDLVTVEANLASILASLAFPGCPLQPHMSLSWSKDKKGLNVLPCHATPQGCFESTAACASPQGGARGWK